MIERFTDSAREVVRGAEAQARELNHPYIGTEHLLLALLDPAIGVPARILRERDLRRDRVVAEIARLTGSDPAPLDRTDAEALRAIGIDLDAVIAAIEASFGPGALQPPSRPRRRSWLRRRRAPSPIHSGHIPFTPRSKRVLELAMRESVQLGHVHIVSEYILLGLLREGDGLGARILVDAGVTLDDLRRRTLSALGDAA